MSAVSGTAYLLLPSPRSLIIKNLATYLKLDVKFADRDDTVYKSNFALNKAPAFLSADGWKLHECLAIIDYFIAVGGTKDSYNFYGSTAKDHAKTIQWLSFANQDTVAAIGNIVFRSHTDEDKAANNAAFAKVADEYESQLKSTAYLTGAEATLADAYAALVLSWYIGTLADAAWFQAHPTLFKWFKDVAVNDPIASLTLKETVTSLSKLS